MNLKKYLNWKTIFVFLLVMLFAAACTSSSDEGTAGEEMEQMEEGAEHEHDADMEHEHDEDMEHSDDHEHARIPNDGAVIHILAPADGATFKADEEIKVEVEVENFTLSDGNHWHVYVDGSSWGMVVGGNMDETLRGLEVGEHEISAFLSLDTHEELEDGDSIMIMVEE